MMPEGLSEKEKWEWIEAQIRLRGMPRRGRPKKGEQRVTWADLGLTRQQIYLFRKMAEIDNSAFEEFVAKFLKEAIAEGNPKKLSRRRILAHFGKINVASDDVFEDTDIGYLAETMLKWAASTIGSLNARQLRYLGRSLNFKLRSMATRRELSD